MAWLERFLRDYAGTVVAITHDRYFLDNVAGWILELDRGRGYPFEGNYSGWLEQKQARLEQEEKADSARRRTLDRELEWVRMAPKARQAKGKARLAAYEKLQAEAEAAERGARQAADPHPARARASATRSSRSTGLSKGYGDRLLIDDLSFSLPRAGIVGIIGPNGAGKTTLFRMITGAEQPDAGTITIGSTVELAYVDQSRDALDPDKTVYEEITGGQDLLKVGNREVNGRAYVASFNFKGSDQQKKVGVLSGGERNRVHLAKMLRTGGNVLLLDEPTNDLDVDTLRALEDALEAFPGCAVVISHDRWFLDRIATHILAFEGDSQVRWFEGNFSEYEAWRHKELGAEADQPHRIKYKPLVPLSRRPLAPIEPCRGADRRGGRHRRQARWSSAGGSAGRRAAADDWSAWRPSPARDGRAAGAAAIDDRGTAARPGRGVAAARGRLLRSSDRVTRPTPAGARGTARAGRPPARAPRRSALGGRDPGARLADGRARPRPLPALIAQRLARPLRRAVAVRLEQALPRSATAGPRPSVPRAPPALGRISRSTIAQLGDRHGRTTPARPARRPRCSSVPASIGRRRRVS